MEKEKNKHYIKMTETPVSRLIISLSIPTTISMLITNIYNMADTFFVGKIGTSASGAVGIVFGFMAILQAFGFLFGQGCGSIISRSLGSMDSERPKIIASTGFFDALFLGIIFSVVGFILSEPLMYLLGSTETILPYAKAYTRYILFAAPFVITSFVMNQILRFEGKAALAMVGLTTGGILNMLLDPLFIFVFKMGIDGAGLATALSQIVSFFILLYMFLTGKTQSSISIKYYSRNISDLVQIICTGFPSMIRQGLACISTMILNNCASFYGDSAIAAMAIVNRISFFIFALLLGIGQGFQPVAGFNYGAEKYSRVKRGFFFTLTVGSVLMGCFSLIGLILSPVLIGFFRNDPSVIGIGTFALKIQLITLFLQPLSVCSNMLFQSVGKNKQASVTAIFRSGLFFIPTIILFSHFFGLTGIQIAQPTADIITFAATIPFTVAFLKTMPKDSKKNV